MMRLRRASAITALSTLAWTGTASAGCVWDARASVHPVRDSIGGVDLP
jgi:hypothetical protein